MFKRLAFVVLAAALMAGPAVAAQTKPPAAKAEPKPAAAAARTAPEPPAQPTNIRIEVSITDQTGTNPPAKKVVSMIAGDRQSANVRSSASVLVKQPGQPGIGPPPSFTYRNVTINVDAKPWIVPKEPQKVGVGFGLEYLPKTTSTQEEMEPGMTSWSERLTLILESGKPTIISQAADPTSDRKITVEVTATILK